MNTLRAASALFLAAFGVWAGCAPIDESVDIGDGINAPLEPAGTCWSCYEPPSGRNGLIPQHFWSAVAQHSMRELQNFPLASGMMYAPSGGGPGIPIISSPFYTKALLKVHPDVIEHLVQCALAKNDVVYDPINAKVYQGWWGLGSGWLTAGISTDSDAQQWITACMVARLNNLGVHVNILLEGATPAIDVTEPHNSKFSYNESTLFGNMFDSALPISNSSPAFHAYLCRENDLLGTCPDGGKDWIDRRLCDNAPASCGLVDIGACPTAGGACIPNGTEHWSCRTSVAAPYQVRTIGVQLEKPLDPSECSN